MRTLLGLLLAVTLLGLAGCGKSKTQAVVDRDASVAKPCKSCRAF